MCEVIQKPLFRKVFLPGDISGGIKLCGTFVASQLITFEKELFAMKCQSLVDECTCFCMAIVILDGNVQ